MYQSCSHQLIQIEVNIVLLCSTLTLCDFFAEYQKFSQKKGHTVQSFEKPVVLKVALQFVT